jgi:hypothetical protein
MKLEFNRRGNGACPLCASNGDCRLQKRLSVGIADSADRDDGGMEIVVYSCPDFKERA